tara:strand:- start:1765 stop:2238 length:474 start_codon:yes stop_codon:yes gene_type:complete
MGNLADKKRLRELAGEKIYKGESVISEKDEMMFIPFIQSGNPDEARPWLYKGYYKMPDGAINMELKRMEGQIELKVDSIDNYREYIGEAVGGFVKKVYEQSPHDAKTISMEKHETEVDLLKKEIIRLQLDAENADQVKEEAKAVLEKMSKQRGMTRE